MNLITDIQYRAVERALELALPFALFALPGEEALTLWAEMPRRGEADEEADNATEADRFYISAFAADEAYTPSVTPQLSAEQILALDGELADNRGSQPDEFPYLSSTLLESYADSFVNMTARLKKNGGKVVLSRHDALFGTESIVDVALEYFRANPSTFRYLCFTPESGLWFGATPELLLETDPATSTLRTMALAGTLPIDSEATWDDKNLSEHVHVVAFIVETLGECGLTANVEPTRDLCLRSVRHLFTPVWCDTSERPDLDPFEVVGALNPTPAVAGVPIDQAVAEIDIHETHQRRYYSGCVGVMRSGALHAYVNLRCAFAAAAELLPSPEAAPVKGTVYNLYGGGGLMPESNVATEWDEITRKLSPLTEIILADSTAFPISRAHAGKIEFCALSAAKADAEGDKK